MPPAPSLDTGRIDAGPALQGRTTCFHCGQEVATPGRWLARVEGGDREMCCAGCQAVAQAIVAAGLDDYYRHRAGPAAGPEAVPPELAQLRVFDAPEVQARFVRDGGQCLETTLLLDGLRCGACVWLIERSLGALPGVTAASVNFATERAVVRWDPARTRLSELLSRIAAVGYRAMPFDAQRREAQLARATRLLFRRLFVAGIGMMQVMMYAFPAYTAQAAWTRGRRGCPAWASAASAASSPSARVRAHRASPSACRPTPQARAARSASCATWRWRRRSRE